MRQIKFTGLLLGLLLLMAYYLSRSSGRGSSLSAQFTELSTTPPGTFNVPGATSHSSKYRYRPLQSADMKMMRVAVVGAVRNRAKHFPSAMDIMEKLRGLFSPTSVVILYENDSSDGTRQLMKVAQEKNPQYHFIYEDDIVRKYHLATGGFNNGRNRRIAHSRRKYMRKAKELHAKEPFSFIFAVDPDDVLTMSIVETFEGFARHALADWDMQAANRLGDVYDLWALKVKGVLEFDVYHEQVVEGSNQYIFNRTWMNKIFRSIPKDRGLFPVVSSFAGAAAYRPERAFQCIEQIVGVVNYTSRRTGKTVEIETCEHVPFHECILSKGGKNFINTDWYSG